MLVSYDKLILNFKTTDFELFKSTALQIFAHQYKYNLVYHKYCNLLNRTPENTSDLNKIPYLPIQFFKSEKIMATYSKELVIFKSSGTTLQNRSCHYISNPEFYLQHAVNIFTLQYGALKNYCVLGLLPSYIENGDSSLVFMVNHFINLSVHKNSGTFLNNWEDLATTLQHNLKNNIPTLLIGVTYALLDFSEAYPIHLKDTIVMETGGMKGRKKEYTRTEIHEILENNFKVKNIHSEYGMTELLSQAYSTQNGIFKEPPSLKILIRDETDPFFINENIEKKGAINIIDLANYDSCSFIATDDMGYKISENEFVITGRLDIAEMRGCSQLM